MNNVVDINEYRNRRSLESFEKTSSEVDKAKHALIDAVVKNPKYAEQRDIFTAANFILDLNESESPCTQTVKKAIKTKLAEYL